MLIRRPVDIPRLKSRLRRRIRTVVSLKTASALLIPTAVGAQSRSGRYEQPRVTPYEYASSYNNYYEFGTDKADPSKRRQLQNEAVDRFGRRLGEEAGSIRSG
jgi:hypothetical protein